MDHLDHDAHVHDFRHQHIPRDANGDPIFLILPAAMRASYEEQLAACKAGWGEGEPLAVAEAQSLTHYYRQPSPAWLEEAVVQLTVKCRTKAQAKRYAEAQIRMARYRQVHTLKIGQAGGYLRTVEDGRKVHELIRPDESMSWEKARAKASDLSAGKLEVGKASTMKTGYDTVQNDLNEGHSGKYFTLKDRRYRRNGKPARPPTKRPPG